MLLSVLGMKVDDISILQFMEASEGLTIRSYLPSVRSLFAPQSDIFGHSHVGLNYGLN